jgi:hypothetical protein
MTVVPAVNEQTTRECFRTRGRHWRATFHFFWGGIFRSSVVIPREDGEIAVSYTLTIQKILTEDISLWGPGLMDWGQARKDGPSVCQLG